jgi:hypothetical protein
MFMGESYLGLGWRGMANLQRNEFSGETEGDSVAWKMGREKEWKTDIGLRVRSDGRQGV